MMIHVRSILGVSVFCVALGVAPASASTISRVANFLFQCDGTNKTVTMNATGFLPGVAQFIVGAEVTLFENRGGVQYILLRANGDSSKQILSLGINQDRAQVIFPTQLGPFPGFNTLLSGAIVTLPANASGIVPLQIDGVCTGGFGQVQGNVIVWFAAP